MINDFVYPLRSKGGTGDLAEVYALACLSKGAQTYTWRGGNTPDIDLVIDGLRVQVKSSDCGMRSFSPIGSKEEAIGIHLGEGVSPERADWFALVLMSNLYQSNKIKSSVTVRDLGNGRVSVIKEESFPATMVYLCPGKCVRRIFTAPYSNGVKASSKENLWAPVRQLLLWDGRQPLRDLKVA